MKNHSKHVFTQIDSEEYREYQFPLELGQSHNIRINSPTHISISESGGHRVLDASGLSHYIPKGWVHLLWKAKKDAANFVL